jgi:pseudaminic acid synthase
MIQDLAQRFDVTVGFSDHTLGTTAPIAATALGAKVIEKHFILDKSIGGADAEFSLDKEEFAQMVQAVRDTEKLLGKIDYSMSEKKEQSRQFARSLYVAKDIKKGELFTEENIRSVRPGYGMHPKYLKEILGKTAHKDYEFGERFFE